MSIPTTLDAELLESPGEQLTQLLLDRLSDLAVFAVDARGMVIHWSAGAATLYGYAVDEIVGSHLSQLYPPDEAADGRCARDLENAVQFGSLSLTTTRIGKDGQQLAVVSRVTELVDGQGEMRGFGLTDRLADKRLGVDALSEPLISRARLLEQLRCDGLVILDPQAVIRDWNAGAERLTGYKPQEVLGRRIDVLFPADEEGVLLVPHALRIARINGSFEESGRWRRKDGRFVAGDIALQPMQDASGVVGFGLRLHDGQSQREAHEVLRQECDHLRDEVLRHSSQREVATDRLQAELLQRCHAQDKLQRLQTQITELFDAMPVAVQAVSRHGYIMQANRTLLDLLGYEPREFVGHHLAEYQVDDQQADQLHQCMLRGEPVSDLEIVLRAKDGSHCYLVIEGSVHEDEDAVPVYRFFGRNITKRKVVERSLQDRERWFRTLVQNVPAGIFQTDDRGRWLYVNSRLAAMTGVEVEHIATSDWLDAVDPRDRQALAAAWNSAVAQAASFHGEFRAANSPPQQTVWLGMAADPVVDEQGVLTGYLGSLVDVTSHKEEELRAQHQAVLMEQANSHLASSIAAAEQATRLKSQFLANMSHEIRTPLTAILGYTEALLGDRLDGPQRQSLRIIQRNGEHLLRIVDDILDMSRIESDSVEIRWSRVDVRELVDELAIAYLPMAIKKGLRIDFSVAEATPPFIHSDADRLRQILFNLISNAVKFSDQGLIRLTVGPLPDADHSTLLAFDVSDEGPGISDELRHRLFQPFQQGDPSASRRQGGAGLGLAISSRLAQLLGGELQVDSQLTQGSRFRLQLPIATQVAIESPKEHDSPPCDPSAQPNAPAEVSLHGVRILLAEDGIDNQRLFSKLLTVAGAEVVVAENGAEAVDCARREAFDLVLMDMQMPVMDGYEAAQQLRQMSYPCPIVALTAHAMIGDRQRCLDAGCDDYLTKPISRQDLLDAIRRQLTNG